MTAQAFQVLQQYHGFAISISVSKNVLSLKMFLKMQKIAYAKARKTTLSENLVKIED